MTSEKRSHHAKWVTQESPSWLRTTPERPDGSTSVFDVDGSLPDGPVRVIFEDDMYDPIERDGYDPLNVA